MQFTAFKRFISTILVFLMVFSSPAVAQMTVPLEDISRIVGVRENQLRGYGIVAGLDGTGDGQIDFINRSIANSLRDYGINVQNPEGERLNNIAAVMVTATLPAFKKSGDRIDVTISSIGNSDDLSGGVLLETPLMGGNNQVYAVAQGPVTRGGRGDDLHKTTVTIPDGALVEQEVPFEFVREEGVIQIQLDRGNFTTASRAAQAVNSEFNSEIARAENANTIEIQIPPGMNNDVVGFISVVQNLRIRPVTRSRVVINERTGTVVMGENISVRPTAISHRDISLQVDNGDGDDGDVVLPEVTTIDQVVSALNAVGASTDDIISILQALHHAEAIKAPLELM